MTTPRPSPHALWKEAGGDHERYVALMKQHGHLIPTTPRPDALTDESEYERIRAEMLDWAEGRRSWVNLCMANPDDHANTLAQQARIAEMDAAEVAKRAYALVGLAARADAGRELAALREALEDLADGIENEGLRAKVRALAKESR